MSRPVTSTTELGDLDDAWAVAVAQGGDVSVKFGDAIAATRLTGPRDVVRRLLSDALSQVDAAGP